MATERELRNRIRSVENIGQVTRALQAVAASRVRRAQAQALATRPYARKAWDVLEHLARQAGNLADLHPLLEVRPQVRAAMVVLFTSDRGLCGAFNTNLVRAAQDFIAACQIPVTVVTVGRKGRDAMVRSGRPITAEFTHLPDVPGILDVTPIARTAMEDFLSQRVDIVHLVYADFVNMMVQRPVVRRLLPLRPLDMADQALSEHVEEETPREGYTLEYVFEPSPAAILAEVVPRFTELQVYQAVLESLASEHAARMVAMRNATENADALGEDLTLARNKARQGGITRELLDIAGGAEALAQAMAARGAGAALAGAAR